MFREGFFEVLVKQDQNRFVDYSSGSFLVLLYINKRRDGAQVIQPYPFMMNRQMDGWPYEASGFIGSSIPACCRMMVKTRVLPSDHHTGHEGRAGAFVFGESMKPEGISKLTASVTSTVNPTCITVWDVC